jgi:ATP-dependent Lhr-like helicase
MGRSGRKEGEPKIMRGYIECEEPDAKANIFDRLHLPLIQAISISELMFEKWIEPPRPPACDLSTLTQQIISIISETGGLSAEALFDRLCRRGAFSDISSDLFARLLRNLGEQDVIEQMDRGDLILGLKGERLRKDKGFYACFATEEEFSVIHNGQVLGTIQALPQSNDYLLFAGRRWRVIDVNTENHEIHVQPARGWKRPKFSGGPGEVHSMVRKKMREVLSSRKTYAYLNDQASKFLAYARDSAAEASLCENSILELGPRRSALLTWTDSRIQNTLAAMFREQGLECGDEGIGLSFQVPIETLWKAILKMRIQSWNALSLARMVFPRQRRKYDWLLSDELLDLCISQSVLDCEGAINLLNDLTRGEILPV